MLEADDEDDLALLAGPRRHEADLAEICETRATVYRALQAMCRKHFGRDLHFGIDCMIALSSWGDRDWEDRLTVADLSKMYRLDEGTIRDRQRMIVRRFFFYRWVFPQPVTRPLSPAPDFGWVAPPIHTTVNHRSRLASISALPNRSSPNN